MISMTDNMKALSATARLLATGTTAVLRVAAFVAVICGYLRGAPAAVTYHNSNDGQGTA